MPEIWQQIDDFHYSVSNHGRIRNDKSKRILKHRINKDGYDIVSLYSDG